jgi:phosphohistidine phosphatase
MILILVRHGKALSDVLNPKRPLSDRGISDTRRIATFLKNSGIHLDQVFYSTKLRARQTAEILYKTVCPRAQFQEIPGLEPDDPAEPIVRTIDTWLKNTMVVGHLPFLDNLLSHLLGDPTRACPVQFLTGTAVIFEREDRGQWQINVVVNPTILK